MPQFLKCGKQPNRDINNQQISHQIYRVPSVESHSVSAINSVWPLDSGLQLGPVPAE